MKALQESIASCTRCPRLTQYCKSVALEKKRAYRDWTYWGRPVPGFGDPKARIWIVGLAPAAHGANRTGRMFTGDKSGEWLYRALHEAGLASQAESSSRDDGMQLNHTYISAAVRCAPPDNKPDKTEIVKCSDFLKKEFALLKQLETVLLLGKIAYDACFSALASTEEKRRRPKFAHGAETGLAGKRVILSYHPSRQNTQTGRLTWEMWSEIFRRL